MTRPGGSPELPLLQTGERCVPHSVSLFQSGGYRAPVATGYFPVTSVMRISILGVGSSGLEPLNSEVQGTLGPQVGARAWVGAPGSPPLLVFPLSLPFSLLLVGFLWLHPPCGLWDELSTVGRTSSGCGSRDSVSPGAGVHLEEALS